MVKLKVLTGSARYSRKWKAMASGIRYRRAGAHHKPMASTNSVNMAVQAQNARKRCQPGTHHARFASEYAPERQCSQRLAGGLFDRRLDGVAISRDDEVSNPLQPAIARLRSLRHFPAAAPRKVVTHGSRHLGEYTSLGQHLLRLREGRRVRREGTRTDHGQLIARHIRDRQHFNALGFRRLCQTAAGDPRHVLAHCVHLVDVGATCEQRFRQRRDIRSGK